MYYTYFHVRKDTGVIFYVGKGKDDRAWSLSGRNKEWLAAVEKHGMGVLIVDRFEIEEDALAHERYLILTLKSAGFTLANLTVGGGGLSGFTVADETKLKISRSQKGKKLSPEHVAAMRAGQKGKKRSEEARRNMSAAFKGRKHSEETKAKIAASNKNRKNNPITQ